jgi:hypothetical protein
MIRGPHLVIRNRRGRKAGYELFGRNFAGAYLLAAGRLIHAGGKRLLLVFHIGRMTPAERRRFQREVRP